MASPIPNPTIPCSERGVLNTLLAPEREGGRGREGVGGGRERGDGGQRERGDGGQRREGWGGGERGAGRGRERGRNLINCMLISLAEKQHTCIIYLNSVVYVAVHCYLVITTGKVLDTTNSIHFREVFMVMNTLPLNHNSQVHFIPTL